MISRIKNIISFYKDPLKYFIREGVILSDSVKIIEPKRCMFGSEPYLVRIGKNVTLSAGVRFVTHDGGVSVFREEFNNIDVFGNIDIGDNVFIGLNSIIMPNVKIGSNSVVGAGSIVTRDVSSESVVVGSPARKIMELKEYKEKVLKKAHYVRDFDYLDKKKYLNKFFDLNKK